MIDDLIWLLLHKDAPSFVCSARHSTAYFYLSCLITVDSEKRNFNLLVRCVECKWRNWQIQLSWTEQKTNEEMLLISSLMSASLFGRLYCSIHQCSYELFLSQPLVFENLLISPPAVWRFEGISWGRRTAPLLQADAQHEAHVKVCQESLSARKKERLKEQNLRNNSKQQLSDL